MGGGRGHQNINELQTTVFVSYRFFRHRTYLKILFFQLFGAPIWISLSQLHWLGKYKNSKNADVCWGVRSVNTHTSPTLKSSLDRRGELTISLSRTSKSRSLVLGHDSNGQFPGAECRFFFYSLYAVVSTTSQRRPYDHACADTVSLSRPNTLYTRTANVYQVKYIVFNNDK